MENQPIPTIRDLYPHLTEKELAEAEDNIVQYLELVLGIFERTESEFDAQITPLAAVTGLLP